MDLRDSRRDLAERTRDAEEALPKEVRLPGGWIREVTPSGIDLYRPRSLPHNRYHSAAPQYVVKIWVIVGMTLAVILVGYGFYLVAH